LQLLSESPKILVSKSLVQFTLPKSSERTCPIAMLHVTFHNMSFFSYELLTHRHYQNLKEHPLSAVHNLLITSSTTLHFLGRPV
jgi:hypothetical protein